MRALRTSSAFSSLAAPRAASASSKCFSHSDSHIRQEEFMSDPRFPLGRWQRTMELTNEERAVAFDAFAAAPGNLRAAVAGLSDAQLDTPYRDGGWSPRQIAHHLPDSHLNGYVRVKLALTEENPAVKPYDEAAWAELADTALTPV